MSLAATAWAYRQDPGDPGAKFVLVALADFADEVGSCYPSQSTLARMTGQSDRTVRRHLKAMEKSGLIRRERRFGAGGSRTSDRYVLALSTPGQIDQRSDCPVVTVTSGQNDQRSSGPLTTGQDDRYPPDTVSREPSLEPSGNRQGARATRGTRIPDGFTVTDDMRTWARKNTPGVDLDHATAKFTDYWTAVSGSKAVKVDWVATWRNWIRSEFDRLPQHLRREAAAAPVLSAWDLKVGGGR